MSITVYTIGHSSHEWGDFRQLIELPDIGCIVDARSSPRSRWRHFHQREMRARLNRIGVGYVFLGDQLGGHSATGVSDYEAMGRTAAFAAGIGRLLDIAARCRPAILCSEHEPLTCHRFLLVARHLVEQRGVRVEHILRDGRIEHHEDTEERLLALHGGIEDMFSDRRERLAHAYRWQAKRLGAAR